MAPFRPHDSALLLLDHQVGQLRRLGSHPPLEAARCTLALAHAALVLGLPILLTTSL